MELAFDRPHVVWNNLGGGILKMCFLIHYCIGRSIGNRLGMGMMNDGWKYGSTMNKDLRT